MNNELKSRLAIARPRKLDRSQVKHEIWDLGRCCERMPGHFEEDFFLKKFFFVIFEMTEMLHLSKVERLKKK